MEQEDAGAGPLPVQRQCVWRESGRVAEHCELAGEVRGRLGEDREDTRDSCQVRALLEKQRAGDAWDISGGWEQQADTRAAECILGGS